MNSPLNCNTGPFAPRAVYPRDTTAPPVTPADTPALSTNMSERVSFAIPTPNLEGQDDHLRSYVLYSSDHGPSNLLSPEHPDSFLNHKTSEVAGRSELLRVVFTPDDNASPYVPRLYCEVTPQWLPRADWMVEFRRTSRAVTISSAEVLPLQLERLIAGRHWDYYNVSRLAGEIINRVMEEAGAKEESGEAEKRPYTYSLAWLVSALHNEFHERISPETASRFMTSLKYYVLAEFRAWWLARNTLSVTRLRSRIPPRGLRRAFAVAAFVGNLHSWTCIPHSLVKLCLDIIADELSVVEELEAIQHLLSNCDNSLYDHVRLRDFLRHVMQRAAVMTDTSAAVYTPEQLNGSAKPFIDSLLQCISNIIINWGVTGREPLVGSPIEPEYAQFEPDAEEKLAEAAELKAAQDVARASSFHVQSPAMPENFPVSTQMQVPQQFPRTGNYGPIQAPPRALHPDISHLSAQAAYLRQVAQGTIAPPVRPELPQSFVQQHNAFQHPPQTQLQFPISGYHAMNVHGPIRDRLRGMPVARAESVTTVVPSRRY